jgi:hypothetical protein
VTTSDRMMLGVIDRSSPAKSNNVGKPNKRMLIGRIVKTCTEPEREMRVEKPPTRSNRKMRLFRRSLSTPSMLFANMYCALKSRDRAMDMQSAPTSSPRELELILIAHNGPGQRLHHGHFSARPAIENIRPCIISGRHRPFVYDVCP